MCAPKLVRWSKFELPAGVNFINIVRANFLYEHCFSSFSLVTCTVKAAKMMFVRNDVYSTTKCSYQCPSQTTD